MTAWPLGLSGWGSQGAGAGLSAGHERPAGWPAGSGGGEVGLELRRHIYVVETTEMVVGLSTRKAGSQESGGQQGCPQDGEPGEGTELGRARPGLHFVRIPVAPQSFTWWSHDHMPLAPRALQPRRVGDDVRHVSHRGCRHCFHLRVPQSRWLQPQPGHGKA